MNADDIDDYLLTRGPNCSQWPEEVAKRAELVRIGPDIVPALLQQTCTRLRDFANVLTGLGPCGMGYETVMMFHARAALVIFELLNAGAGQNAPQVARYLAVALEDQENVGKRAVAALMCCVRGIPERLLVPTVTKHFDYDVPIVQLCCSLYVATLEKSASHGQLARARFMIESYIKEHPMVKQYYAGAVEGDRLRQYNGILLKHLPIEVAATVYSTAA